jgi:hypothetical protein
MDTGWTTGVRLPAGAGDEILSGARMREIKTEIKSVAEKHKMISSGIRSHNGRLILKMISDLLFLKM